MKRSFGFVAVAVLLCAVGCRSASEFKLQNAFDSLLGDLEGLFGTSSVPAKHLLAIRDVHEARGWVFRKDVDEPLEKTRSAIRALAECDYASWNLAALTIEVLSEISDEHPSSLVRAEALDTLTRMGDWTLKAATPPTRVATDAEVFEAMKTLRDAAGKTDADPAFTFQVQTAVVALANSEFHKLEIRPSDEPAAATDRCRARLRAARVSVKRLIDRTLENFQADPGVHDALERAYVSLSSSVVRLSLAKAALADPADTTRATAVRDLGALAPDDGGAVLRLALLRDTRGSVRREAAKSLAMYPANVAVPALIDGLADELADVRGAAASSLASLTGQNLGDDRAGWLRWWEKSGGKPTASAEAGK